MVPTLKVFLAEDSDLVRERIRSLLVETGVTIVGEGRTPQGCIGGILASRPDVVVLDVRLEGGTGLEVLKAVQVVVPAVAFVVFSNNASPAYRQRYLREGACAFLDKSSEFDQLAPAVAQAHGIAAAPHAGPPQPGGPA